MAKKRYVRKIYSDNMIDKLQDKLNMLPSYKYDADTFMNIRFATTAIVFVLVLYTVKFGYLVAPFISVVYYIVFEYVFVDILLARRGKKLEHEALYFFEILTLTLESGRNLEKSLAVTISNVDSELTS